ncbi:hypothetical protein B9Z55_011534 [Caenorhabditis nigoni]|uniref:Uncharacterized protein n=1 Tax=Caenorhabditis nigoni TaxID=1611254 RepID=A0A2G5UL23_9PELO|nr:hypothetical protein B9Z55_011534 [Caenorhabditis nigoni]
MLAIFFVCFCLGTNVYAGVIATTSTTIGPVDTTTTSDSFDEDAELKKIAETCFTYTNYEELSGYTVRRFYALDLGRFLIRESVEAIGVIELRTMLNLEPTPPWKPWNNTDPSESDLESAATIQAYYELKEPRSNARSLDNKFFYEHNKATGVAYLDKRFPAIREIFRRRFEKVRVSMELVDRKGIDRMIETYYKVYGSVMDAIAKMQDWKKYRMRCLDSCNLYCIV